MDSRCSILHRKASLREILDAFHPFDTCPAVVMTDWTFNIRYLSGSLWTDWIFKTTAFCLLSLPYRPVLHREPCRTAAGGLYYLVDLLHVLRVIILSDKIAGKAGKMIIRYLTFAAFTQNYHFAGTGKVIIGSIATSGQEPKQ